MFGLLKTFLQIALFRRGPEDLPASPAVLALTALAWLVVNAALAYSFLTLPQSWQAQLLFQLALGIAWYYVLLRLFRRPERFLQTATASYGVGLLLAPLLVPALTMSQQPIENPEHVSPLMILLLPVVVYVVAVMARILRSALEIATMQCVLLVILQVFTEALLTAALFGPVAPEK
jgi:hypothetical protein